MVAICVLSESKRAVNLVADDLIKKHNDYVVGATNTVLSPSGSVVISRVSKSQDEITKLYENAAIFNDFINRTEVVSKITPISYPNIANRVEKNKFITPLEVGEMIDQSISLTPDKFLGNTYNPETIEAFREASKDFKNNASTVSANADISLVDLLEFNSDDRSIRLTLQEFEYYLGKSYKSDESMSSFCDMVPSIFEKLERYTNVFNSFKKLVGYVSDKINSIKDEIAGASFAKLEETVTSYVDKTFKREMERIANFKSDIILGSQALHKRVVTNLVTLKEKAAGFFTQQNLDDIKGSIKAQIQYVLDFFKEPALEEIQYIIYRFCTLLTTLKNLFSSKIEPLKKYVQGVNETNLALQTAGNLSTARAIRAGAVRLEPQVYDQVKANNFAMIKERSIQEQGNYNPAMIEITPMDADKVTPWNDGQGDSRIGFSGQWVTKLGQEGWIGTKPENRIMLMQLQELFGKRLIVNSAYRPEWYNKTIPNAAARSLHMSGLAFDITWSGFNASEASRFRQLAKQVGFTGFGVYSSFNHIDTGKSQTFNGGY